MCHLARGLGHDGRACPLCAGLRHVRLLTLLSTTLPKNSFIVVNVQRSVAALVPQPEGARKQSFPKVRNCFIENSANQVRVGGKAPGSTGCSSVSLPSSLTR